MKARVGFIGLGQMGFPMLARLSQARTPTVAFDLDSDTRERAAGLPYVIPANSLADLVESANVIFTCLPSSETVRSVYLGENGIGRQAASDIVTCDCSTIEPDLATAVHDGMRSCGARHLDAPIFGTPQQAQVGDIYFAVSGAQEDMDSVAPFLAAMSRGYQYVGGPGTAHYIKILQNGLGNSYAAVTAEILALGRLLGVDLPTFVSVVNEARALGWSVYFNSYAEAVVQGNDTGGARLYIGAKDTSLVRDFVRKVGLRAPILQETAKIYDEAMQEGLDSHEFTAVSRVIELRMGRNFFPELKKSEK